MIWFQMNFQDACGPYQLASSLVCVNKRLHLNMQKAESPVTIFTVMGVLINQSTNKFYPLLITKLHLSCNLDKMSLLIQRSVGSELIFMSRTTGLECMVVYGFSYIISEF
jgi:hypothetical protein